MLDLVSPEHFLEIFKLLDFFFKIILLKLFCVEPRSLEDCRVHVHEDFVRMIHEIFFLDVRVIMFDDEIFNVNADLFLKTTECDVIKKLMKAL